MTQTPDARTERTDRRAGELTPRELLRWAWRQLTSMRTALILLLLLALAAVPGSVIPQENLDSLETSRWREAHPTLAPIYDRLGLFDVYGSVWFAAVYILLMVSLIGCILPRTWVYLRAIRAEPPRAPRNLERLPDHASYDTDLGGEAVLTRARAVLRERGYRVRAAADGDDAVSAERGYLREVGNLLFHLSVVVVLVGFAMGGLFGYKGGMIVVVGTPVANTPNSYDDLVPGTLFQAEDMDPFVFTVDDFDVEWIEDGPGIGTSRGFASHLTYRERDGEEKEYRLRVNHPLKVGSTELFLIGHGYAPVITVRDGEGNIAYSGPTIFLPQGPDLLSFGVVKAPDARPEQIGLDGLFFPTFVMTPDGDLTNVPGRPRNPLLSMSVYRGDLDMDAADSTSQSVYVLDTSKATKVEGEDGKDLRLDLSPGETAELPDGLGSVTFERVVDWNRIQISQTPGKRIALAGVVLALVGLLGSLFIRPRRVWVRAVAGGGGTLVTVAALDRTGGGDVTTVIEELVEALAEEEKT
ncbi:cytochrome c biogenesis protein ResB [Nocardioides sp. SYSU D00038]|uniref:cytochrome c biogenesis protein ResB n=1 Tax=Nocardioides sp. SYSU D00038 TaxID=2812554 RepID=UPI0027DB745D|nr:cytochrome c biogenesis protein ResB [Nocardioides sp. SYSU D00038]